MHYQEIIKKLKSRSSKKNIAGMARFGINPRKTFGVPIPFLRSMAKKVGKDHKLADQLWRSGYHEARILAGMIDDPKLVTPKQMDRWASDFNSWDICDQACSNLFDRTNYSYQKAFKWARSSKEYIKRAGFAMMAVLAVHDKKTSDAVFERFYPVIIKGSTDERNFVKKAVNWALRQIGKRNNRLRAAAIKTAKEIIKMDSRAAKWVASDALRELKAI